MTRTYFQDFNRDDGSPVTVEYSASGGEPNFDYPGHICDGGGSGPDIVILRAWPNTPLHERLANIYMRIRWPARAALTPFGWWLCTQFSKPIQALMRLDEWWHASLTAAEYERMESWLAEH